MKKEIWKAIEGYEGWYEVSSFGRVRSLDRVIFNSDGRKRLWKGIIMKIRKDRGGYLTCCLRKNSKCKLLKVHRLVAQTLIPNPDNLPQVNHKDEVKTNNHVDNLEWCDSKYNVNYGTAIQRRTETQLNSLKLSKPVLQIDKNSNEIITEYPSANEAARKLNINQGSISNCCNGNCKTYKGFKWKYKRE